MKETIKTFPWKRAAAWTCVAAGAIGAGIAVNLYGWEAVGVGLGIALLMAGGKVANEFFNPRPAQPSSKDTRPPIHRTPHIERMERQLK